MKMVKYILALMLIALNTYAVRTEKEVFLFTNKVGIGSTNLPEQVLEVDGQGVFDSIALKGMYGTNLILSHYNNGLSNYFAMIMEGTTTTNLYPLVTTEVPPPPVGHLSITSDQYPGAAGEYFLDNLPRRIGGDHGVGASFTNFHGWKIVYTNFGPTFFSPCIQLFSNNTLVLRSREYGVASMQQSGDTNWFTSCYFDAPLKTLSTTGNTDIVTTSPYGLWVTCTNTIKPIWCGFYKTVSTNPGGTMFAEPIFYFEHISNSTFTVWPGQNGDADPIWYMSSNEVPNFNYSGASHMNNNCAGGEGYHTMYDNGDYWQPLDDVQPYFIQFQRAPTSF